MDILRNMCNLKLQVSIDGLPLYKSSATQFWPILGTVQNLQEETVTIGLFCGESKPSSLDEYLEDFICEIKHLSHGLSHGFQFES